MFNYKTWKLYYPGDESAANPFGPSANSVVDENGNSITPDSLKKNMTIPAEGPGNDLEKVLSNMNGADPAYPVEGASGLIKQMNELAENPTSGVPEADEEGLVLTTGTKGNKITIIDTHIKTFMLYSDDYAYQGTWEGFDESLIKWPAGIGQADLLNGTIDGDVCEYIIANDENNGHCIVTSWGHDGHIRFFPDGTFRAWIRAGRAPEALDSDFFLDIDKIEPVWAPMPATATATASEGFREGSTLDMTAEEIMNALSNGPVFVQSNIYDLEGETYQYGIVIHVQHRNREGSPYYFRVLTHVVEEPEPVLAVFTAASITDYPVFLVLEVNQNV